MAILIFTVNYRPHVNGIANYSYEIAKNLTQLGERVIVLAPYYKGSIKFDRKQKFNTFRVPHILFLRESVSLFYILYIIYKFGIDKIFNIVWFPYGVISYFISHLIKIPYFVAVFGREILPAPKSIKKRILRKLKRLMIKTFDKAEKIFPVSNYTKGKLIDLGIPSVKIKVVPSGVNPESFFPQGKPNRVIGKYNLKNKKIILTVGRLVGRKGQDMVIKSLPKVLEEVPDVAYLIVGSGIEEKDLFEGERIKRLVKDLNLEEKVIFTGFVCDEDLPQYYNSCDVFVMPSREITEKGDVEGFGIVYLEANACAKPVIGGKSGGIEDAIIDGETGLLVDPLNVKEIARVIVKLLTNKELADEMGKKGRERVEKELNWKEIARRLQGLM